jgi:hypothetical protein
VFVCEVTIRKAFLNRPQEENPEIEEMREEVDEARRLAEEWEQKYKEMQRQVNSALKT